MTPTLPGRLQTRLFIILVIGSAWTLAVGPLLPRPPGTLQIDVYRMTFQVLAIVAVVGLLWELLYHALQQFRWEKDWPTLFGLLEGTNEGIVAWFIARALIGPDLPLATFVVHFTSTWVVTWLWANGPMRVLFLRWRFMGGRLL